MTEGSATRDRSSGSGRRQPAAPAWLLLPPALVCLGLSAFLALRQPLFVGGDERAHLLYVASVIDGRLPEFGDDFGAHERVPVVERSLEGTAKGTDIDGVWVAYHPPVPYLVAAPPVWIAGEVGPDTWPAVAMRLVNAGATATGVVFVGLFAGEAFARRRGVGFAAACLTAVVANLVAIGSGGLNDGVGFAVAGAGWYVAARLLRRGPTAGSIGAACAAASTAMLTRISLAPIAAMLAGAACVSVWRHRRGPGTVARGIGAGMAVAASALVSSGWFYWRNHQLYGRLSAPEAPPELARVRPRPGTLVDVLTDATFHRNIWAGVYGTVSGPLAFVHGRWLVAGLAALMAVGLGLAAVRRQRRRPGTARPIGRERPRLGDNDHGDIARPAHDGEESTTPGAAPGVGPGGWALILGGCAAVIVGTAEFVGDGGAPHPRYLFPVLPVASALLARAIDELPHRRLVLAGVVGVLATVTLTQLARVPELLETLPLVAPFDRAAVGPPGPQLALALALVAGLASVRIGWHLRGHDTSSEARGSAGGPPADDADVGRYAPAASRA